ncbi:enhancer of polycomb-like-domain-containing protein [Xylariales sp. PMI_506]|nr:enhancer of polycomb-like-domain-containing protein [Xylariales sp. PMI_506]
MSSTRKVRVKKLNPKHPLSILVEGQIDPSEYESLTTEQKAHGVDAAEADEVHLQAALKGSGVSTDTEIPVPPPQQSEVNYDDLYPRPFIEPRNYIKFSETVEETLGCLYDMTTEDDEYLRTYNTKKPAREQLSENDFEKMMELFEQTAAEQAPFAAVDNTVVPYEVMAQNLVHSTVSKLQNHAKQVYEYWKTCRQASGNKGLHPSLKFETHTEQDDLDPYVCFRRREVRQTRKTRQRDVQIADKLKKLRKELEDGRQLVVMSQQRELLKRELLVAERQLFEHRARLKERKVRLGIKSDDEDLFNTKPQKRKIQEVQPPVRAGPNTQLRLAVRMDGKPAEQDLVLLSDKIEEKWDELRRDVDNKYQTHKVWNQNHIDLTDKPLPPAKEEEEPGFRTAKVQFLPTPPASASDRMELDEDTSHTLSAPKPSLDFMSIRTRELTPEEPAISYRRRHGRNNRIWIDRRNTAPRDAVSRLASPPSDTDPDIARRYDRMKYDHDDDSDDEQPVYEIDPYDLRALKFRASIPLGLNYQQQQQRYYRQLPEGSTAAQAAAAGSRPTPAAQAAQTSAQAPTQTPSQSKAPPQPQPPVQPQASAAS